MNTQSNPAEPRSEWDAIIIGAGLGGLTCAAYLATTGRRVLVLEQFSVAGGNSHVFRRRRRYEFDVGIHYLGDCGQDGIIPAILNGVGLAGRTEFLEMDPDGFDQVRVQGLELDVPTGWSRYRERLKAALPDEADAVDAFVDISIASAEEQRFALLAGEEVTPVELANQCGTTRRWGRRTLDQLFDHCGLSARARTVLAAQAPNYGLTPRQVTVGRHTSVFDHYLRGAYYPAGGGQVIAAGLVEVIEAHGGEVRTNARVEKILVEGGRVTGVGLGDSEVITAPLVVSNADYRRTVLELAGAAHFPAKTVDRTRSAVMSMPWLVLYLGLDTDLRERPNANLWWYDEDIDTYFDKVSRGEADDVRFLFASFASRKDPDNRTICPPGHANLQVMTPSPAAYHWWGVEGGPAAGVPYRRNPTYREQKEWYVEATLRAAERAIGPLRDHITHLEAATPLTHERYILSSGGTPCGLAEWGNAKWPDTATTVEGLHVVGANTRYGSGVAGVMVSGIMCAGQILGRRLLSEAHRGSVFGEPALLPERDPEWDPRDVCRGAARRGRGATRRRMAQAVD
ncbi:phytoene desaturase family protein [Amycolatopsis cihanbeyliensis]|uniref:Phytoene dehydrogenase-like protein n=1 Tax=Amycolatopsis cihanbeyliensis TaxID=1128664 RepID=A0A542DE70_AMYCI|nr:NAD(P)/FAD-dependent oxidoreductase [Amycolatopsis cihanbeyliensis]TQJ01369.1 phytoene dehydrogenase-like protein [Amycolatopsis cihanbeyliensis]